MKKTILILLSVLFSLSMSAQDGGGGHMAFNGIPMEGSIRAYADKLIQGGCRLVEDGEDSIVLSGDHLDWKDVTIITQVSQVNNVVPTDVRSGLASVPVGERELRWERKLP